MNGDTFSIKAPKECSKIFAATFKGKFLTRGNVLTKFLSFLEDFGMPLWKRCRHSRYSDFKNRRNLRKDNNHFQGYFFIKNFLGRGGASPRVIRRHTPHPQQSWPAHAAMQQIWHQSMCLPHLVARYCNTSEGCIHHVMRSFLAKKKGLPCGPCAPSQCLALKTVSPLSRGNFCPCLTLSEIVPQIVPQFVP